MTRHTTNAFETRKTLTALLRSFALSNGFDAFGVCEASILEPERERFLKWIADGRQGDMAWLTPEWATKASDATAILPEAMTVICVAMSYAGRPTSHSRPGMGRMARYASGIDYHSLIQERLQRLALRIREAGGATHPFVDTAPTMDKALAARAGLGWQGKNTNIMSKELGSFLLLGGIVTDLDLETSIPVADGCGSCRLCQISCPTGALNSAYRIDARRCISYLTIEHRGPIPRELRGLMGDWVFGCDICQDVCPPVTRLQDREFPEDKARRVKYVRTLAGNAS